MQNRVATVRWGGTPYGDDCRIETTDGYWPPDFVVTEAPTTKEPQRCAGCFCDVNGNNCDYRAMKEADENARKHDATDHALKHRQ
jgi:hypothetical protein